SIQIDLTPPAEPVVQPISSLIKTATPTFGGTAEAASTVKVVVDPDDDATTLNSFTLTTTAVGGYWSVAVPAEHAFQSGQRVSFTVTATDAAQNVSIAATGSFEVDTTRPTPPILSVPGLINASNATLGGLAEPGSTVTITQVFGGFNGGSVT